MGLAIIGLEQLSAGTERTLNNTDRDQVLWARETDHRTQTLVFTETAGHQPGHGGHSYLRSSWNKRETKVSGRHLKRFLILRHTKEFKSHFAFEVVSTFKDAQKVTGNSFNCYIYPKVTKP